MPKTVMAVSIVTMSLFLNILPAAYSAQDIKKIFIDEMAKQIESRKQQSQVLYDVEKRVFEIDQEVRKILETLKSEEIKKPVAVQKLRILLKEKKELQSRTDYLVDQQIFDELLQRSEE